MKIYLNTEIATREVLGNLLLGAMLAARGHHTVLIHQEDNFVLRAPKKRRGVVFHTKSLNYSSGWIGLHSALRSIGYIITSHDQEGSGTRDMRNFVAGRYCVENLALTEAVFAWTKDEKFWLDKLFPSFSENVFVTGSPRTDVWKSAFRNLGDHLKTPGPYILLTPSVSLNVEPQYWRTFEAKMSTGGFGSKTQNGVDEVMQEILDSLSTQIPFCRMSLKLADLFPSHRVIIRPRPDESHDAWLTLLSVLGASDSQLSRVLIDNQGALEEWIHGASLVINATSTAGLNALFSETPLIVFGDTTSPFNRMGYRCESEDEVISAARKALSRPERFVKSYRGTDPGLVFHPPEQPDYLAAEAMVSRWLKHSDGNLDSKLGFEDFLLWFQPGFVRRSIKNFLNFWTRAPQITIPPSSVLPLKREDIARQLEVIARALGIEGDLKFQIRGRQNLVIFPIHETARQSSEAPF